MEGADDVACMVVRVRGHALVVGTHRCGASARFALHYLAAAEHARKFR